MFFFVSFKKNNQFLNDLHFCIGCCGNIETCFESIEQSIDSISSLEFNYPRHFTNSLLKLKNIATLIRDAELHENMLFTVEKGQKEPQKTNRQCFKMPVTPLKSKESLSPETLLIAAKRLLDIWYVIF
ncbi:unnamed protein product [Pneumocystis jirovecii]|uniref:DASH complex subunit SPC34 n=1 Tax=Pneumocystis jirovecii TaxID=42068 RepID=L0P856_PNEJI|nr:unnamed protein product [Pneumocystis jirovecii]